MESEEGVAVCEAAERAVVVVTCTWKGNWGSGGCGGSEGRRGARNNSGGHFPPFPSSHLHTLV